MVACVFPWSPSRYESWLRDGRTHLVADYSGASARESLKQFIEWAAAQCGPYRSGWEPAQ
jgi:hypothetical protein